MILIRFKQQVKNLQIENSNQFGIADNLSTTHKSRE